jgi:hypothetical protein
MLCTTCAALAGASITHQITRASASHPKTVFAFNVASQGAQTARSRARGRYTQYLGASVIVCCPPSKLLTSQDLLLEI